MPLDIDRGVRSLRLDLVAGHGSWRYWRTREGLALLTVRGFQLVTRALHCVQTAARPGRRSSGPGCSRRPQSYQCVTLRDALRREGCLPPSEALNVLRDVCAAVELAHRRPLIHRDLKPENNFLVRGDAGERVKVLDFGIAKFLPAGAGFGDEQVTGAGMLLGTPQYMAPEQLRGEAVTPACDLWALAVIAYEMLTGAHPFARAPDVDAAATGLPGYTTALTAHLAGTPARWQAFFAHALALDPADRPRSAAIFLAELEEALRTDQARFPSES